MNELQWDKKLKINTCGRDDSMEDENHYPYEPTPYKVLIRLAQSGYIDKNHILLDYGCGLGRVSFFLNYMVGCKTIGIEYDKKTFGKLKNNEQSYSRLRNNTKMLEFYFKNAEEFKVDEGDCFFFFNPFSIKILQSVIGEILNSYYDNPREMKLFFYYPNSEYISYLMTHENLMFFDEIDCMDLFEEKVEREKILIFEVN